ncbi:FO synthase subunit 1, partial [Durusdinium trenchii]
MTLYPPGAAYVKSAFHVLASVTAMSPQHCGFIMLPVLQKQTTDIARIKHRRTIEDHLVKGNMSIGQETTVFYVKPDAGPRDGRPLAHVCLMTTHNSYSDTPWMEADPVTAGRVGPFPLIRISDMLGYDEATRPSASARVEQRGVPCGQALMKSLVGGMDIRDTDKLVWFDIAPNRHAEHARAALQTLLAKDGDSKKFVYVGFVRDEKITDLRAALESQVYESWEACPVQFNEGSEERAEIAALQAEFEKEFGGTSPGSTKGGDAHRASALCDFSIDEGLRPLDCKRVVDLPAKPISDFSDERLGAVAGKGGKPTMVLTKDFHVWLLNSTSEAMEMDAGELFGFGTGQYQNQVVSRESEETLGLAWRLASDRNIVSHEKTPTALCQLMRKCAVEQGLADLELEFHVLAGKMHPATVQVNSSPPKILPVKPKVYLLAKLTIPAASCVDLS